MKYIVSNFASWKTLNEAESPGRTKQTAGIGQKVVGIPIDEKSFKVKIVHDLDVLDATGKMTPQGWKSIYDWLMAQPKWPLYYTGLKDMTNNFVVYSVNKDNDRKQLITFVIAPRTAAPGIPAEVQIVRQEDLATMVKDQQKVTILDQQTKKAEDTNVNTSVAGGGTTTTTGGYVAGKKVTLTTPITFDALKTTDSSQAIFGLVKAVYMQMQNNPAIKKLTFFSKLKDELKSGVLGENAVLLMKGIIAGFTLNDEYGDPLEQVTQAVVDKLQLFVPAQTPKKNESKYYLGLNGRRIYEQTTTDVVVQGSPTGNLPAGFNMVAFSKAVGGAPAAAITTGDIKVPDGGFKKGSVAKGDAELKKVQQLIIDKFAKKLAAKPLYQKFKGFGADGNWGPTTEKMIAYLQGGFKLTVDGSIISSELINKIQTNKIDESYLGLNYRIVEQFDMDAADATEKTYKPKPSSSTKKDSTKKDSTKKDSTKKKEDAKVTAGVPKRISVDKISAVAIDKTPSAHAAFTAALINVSIKMLGQDFGDMHLGWIAKQAAVLSNLSNYKFVQDNAKRTSYLSAPYTYIGALSGSDASLKTAVDNLGLSKPGSAKTDDQVKAILSAIHTKMDETYISDADENAMVAAVYLISPNYPSNKLATLSSSLGYGNASGLGSIYDEIDSQPITKIALMVWACGALSKNPDDFKNPQFTLDQYNKAVADITSCLVDDK